MSQEALQKVYSDYSAKFEVPPFEQFAEQMSDSEKRKLVYQDLSKEYEMPAFEDFESQLNSQTQYPFHGPQLLGAALTGFGTSNIGAEVAKLRGTNIEELSQVQPQGLVERIAYQGGRLLGDLPSMFAGGLLGTAGGLITGPGAVLTGGAGAFALPRAIEAAQRSETFQEALPEVGKSAALGAATAGVGGVVGKLAPALKVPAEIGALTFGGAGLEGRLPSVSDIVEATALVYGLKFSHSIAEKVSKRKAQAEKVLATKKEPTEVDISNEIASIQNLIKEEAVAQKIQPKTQEQRLQERAEDAEIQSAISREKVRQSDEAYLLSKGYSAEKIKGLKAKSGVPSTREVEQSDFASNKEAMLKAAEKTQQEANLPEAVKETLRGLGELLKPGGELRSGVGFSEESYLKAKPHFQKAWESYKAAGRNFREFSSEMLAQGGENLKPFLEQFQKDQVAQVRQNFSQVTQERVNQASQSTPEERVPSVEDIQWLSRVIFTPQRAVSTKLRSGFGKTNIEVNLEHPKAQDIAANVLTADSKTSQLIQTEISHATNTQTEFYKGISRLPQGLSSRVYFAETKALGDWFKAVASNPTNLKRVPVQFQQSIKSLFSHYKLTDAYVKGDAARGIPSYAEIMEQAGATKQQINAGLKKLQLADIRLRSGQNIFSDFKAYLAFVNRHLSMDPVQVQVKKYMKENPELFPQQIRQTVEEQLLAARGEKSWVEDRVLDGAIRLLSGGRLQPYKSFSQLSQSTRRGEANLKLGYRPISAFVDLAQSVGNTLIKRQDQPLFQSLRRTAEFMKSTEGKKFLKDEETAGSLQIGLDTDYSGRPIPKEALWKPLGLRSASEVGQRKFALAYSYQNALAKGMSEPVAREYARRMLHLTQGTYVLSGMRQFMRAPLSKSLFQFKEYIGRTLELMHTFSKKEWAEYIGLQMAMSGPRGLVLFAKSIPMMALLGVLDKVEDALNTYKGPGKELVSGLPGAAGADIAAQATLQVAPEAQDAGGVLIGDAIKIFKNFVLPLAGPGRYLTARAFKEFGDETLRKIIPQYRNVMDIWDSVVDQEGWVRNSEGKKSYQLNSNYDRVLKALGASSVEESKLRVAERLKFSYEEEQKDAVRFLLRVATKDRLTGGDAAKAIEELGKLGIQSSSIESAFKQRLLSPQERALLRAKLIQKARVMEFYDFE